MKTKFTALVFGTGFGFVIAWARITDPMVIRRMLRLQEADVFLLMGAAIVVAAIGVRLLRAFGARAVVTSDAIAWTTPAPARHHVIGSVIFGIGWSVAATCPGPMLAMIGQGRLAGLFVAAGVLAGLALQGAAARRRMPTALTADQASATCV
jgi:uncharacterized membrane protein YedE/YeeE